MRLEAARLETAMLGIKVERLEQFMTHNQSSIPKTDSSETARLIRLRVDRLKHWVINQRSIRSESPPLLKIDETKQPEKTMQHGPSEACQKTKYSRNSKNIGEAHDDARDILLSLKKGQFELGVTDEWSKGPFQRPCLGAKTMIPDSATQIMQPEEARKAFGIVLRSLEEGQVEVGVTGSLSKGPPKTPSQKDKAHESVTWVLRVDLNPPKK